MVHFIQDTLIGSLLYVRHSTEMKLYGNPRLQNLVFLLCSNKSSTELMAIVHTLSQPIFTTNDLNKGETEAQEGIFLCLNVIQPEREREKIFPLLAQSSFLASFSIHSAPFRKKMSFF